MASVTLPVYSSVLVAGTYGRSPSSSAVGIRSRQISSPRARITTSTTSRASGRPEGGPSPAPGEPAVDRRAAPAWMNGYGTPRRCTERRGVVVGFYLLLAAAFVVTRCLIRKARTRYRWLGDRSRAASSDSYCRSL